MMLVVGLLFMCFMHSACPLVLPTPTALQLEWSKFEVGAMISFGMETSGSNVSDIGFCGFETGNWLPPTSWFNPLFIDTDAWARAMVAFGAKYAVFTAKHCTGFALWPTKVAGYDYGVSNCPWMNGTADIVASYIASCKKYGIKPGLYYSVGNNYYLNVHNGEVQPKITAPGQRSVTSDEYESIVLAQLTELWTQYGEFVEIWFDGGTFSWGGALSDLVTKLQPNAIAFQGPAPLPNVIRWIGNEMADPPYPCWSTANNSDADGGGSLPENNPVVWAPGESDTTIRNHDSWFWTDDYYSVGIKSLGTLMMEYEQAAGRNTNYLLNLSPDPYGVIPVADMAAYEQLGAAITKCYGKAINQTQSQGKNDTQLKLVLPQAMKVNRIVIQEDQTQGQIVRTYKLSYAVQDNPNSYQALSTGSSIGNKRIEALPSDITAQYLLLDISGVVGGPGPIISNFAAYYCDRLY